MDDLFGDDDDVIDNTEDENIVDEQHAQQILVLLLTNDVKSRAKVCNPANWEPTAVENEALSALKPRVLVLCDPQTLELADKVREKLVSGSFFPPALAQYSELIDVRDTYDVVIALSADVIATEERNNLISKLQRRDGRECLISGGSFVALPTQSNSLPAEWNLSYRHWETISSNSSSGLRLMRKRAVLCNETAAIYWTNNLVQRPLSTEYDLLQRISVPLSVAERDSGVLSAVHRQRIVQNMREHGLCVISNLVSTNAPGLQETTNAAVKDIQELLGALSQGMNLDLLCPRGDNDLSENFREVSLREFRRLDVRDTRRLHALAPDPAADKQSTISVCSVGQGEKKDAKGQRETRWLWPQVHHHNAMHTTTPSTNGDSNRQFTTHIPTASDSSAAEDVPLLQRLRVFHPSLLSALHETLVPSCAYATGNWGRWNFEGPGPFAPQSIAVSRPGIVCTFPGCADQTIHADTPHLFEVEHAGGVALPAHYLNYFLPLPRWRSSSSSSSVEGDDEESVFDLTVPAEAPAGEMLYGTARGQTVFICGSHTLSSTHRLLVQQDETLLREKLVRPLLCPGDALIFDCRVLHFGSANQYPTTSSSTSPAATSASSAEEEQREKERLVRDPSHWRPLIYINVTRDWFNDPKNWNNRRSAFGDAPADAEV